MVSKENETSWMASGLRTGTGMGAIAVDVEAVAVMGVGADGSAAAGDALGVSTLSVVGLLSAGLNFPDTWDIRVIG
jgi:hypothetical protein